MNSGTKDRTIKEGWLYHEESVQGSLSTWKKRWSVLTLLKLQCYKNTNEEEPISSLPVSSIEEMARGANVGDKTWAFSLTTPRGEIKFAAMDEEERESWVSTLRVVVPKAKVEIAREALIRKAKRRANLELAQQQIKESIESILRDSKRVGVRGGFKSYADALAENFQGLLKAIDLVSGLGLHSARQCAYTISSIVDAANSAAAVCTNKAIQDEIVIRTRDIAIDTAGLLGHATNAGSDKKAQQRMYESIEDIQEQVKEILEILSASGLLQQEMDDAKENIEIALENSFATAPGKLAENDIQQSIDALTDRSKVLSTTIRNIANNACVTPDLVGQYSQEASQMMCELLEGTSVVAVQSGIDVNDPEYIAGATEINPRKKQQVESLLAAAKGFAAATTNMIDLLKQVPRQEDDENIQFRLSQATRSADTALNAFNSATGTLDTNLLLTSGNTDYSITDLNENYVDGETELLSSLDAITATVTQFSVNDIKIVNPDLARKVEVTEYNPAGGSGGNSKTTQVTVVDAARMMCSTAKDFMTAATESQSAIKKKDPNVYRNDPQWTSGLVEAAQSVADTTNQMYEVSTSPNSDIQDVVAAARCINEATARLVAFTRVKADSNSTEQQKLEEAARSMARAANFVVETAKRAQQSGKNEKTTAESEMARLRHESTTKQIKKEFEAQAEIAKLEAELEEARQYLFKLRRVIHGGGPTNQM